MSARTRNSGGDLEANELRLDRLLGRRVFGRNNHSIGRIEEFRADKRGTGCIVTEYVIGSAGLLERLGVGVSLILGRARRGGYVARWDQVDVSDPDRPRLTCSVAELRKL
jgi:hypothetical protein